MSATDKAAWFRWASYLASFMFGWFLANDKFWQAFAAVMLSGLLNAIADYVVRARIEELEKMYGRAP